MLNDFEEVKQREQEILSKNPGDYSKMDAKTNTVGANIWKH